MRKAKQLFWKIKHHIKIVLFPKYRCKIEELKHEIPITEEEICWLIFGCAPEEVDWNRVADIINESNLSVVRSAKVFNKLDQERCRK